MKGVWPVRSYLFVRLHRGVFFDWIEQPAVGWLVGWSLCFGHRINALLTIILSSYPLDLC